MDPIIQLEEISKRYEVNIGGAKYNTLRQSIPTLFFSRKKQHFWALRNISFKMHAGETMGIIGSNGAGKTTLLKILSRITQPTSGKGFIRGRVGSLLEVGTGFHPELTGKENIYLNGVILNLTKKEIDKQFEKIVEFAGVSRFLNTPIKHYSTGMWARLAFSVAAYLDPEILLIDEVLSVGDTEFQKKSINKMNDLSNKGRTVIFVSHNMPAVRQLCEKCILIEEGRIIKTGKTNDVIDEYLKNNLDNHNGFIDLTDFKKRKGSQQVKLNKIELRNQRNEVTSQFLMKDDLSIHLFFTAKQFFRTVRIIVDIVDSRGDVICNMFDSDSGFRLSDVNGTVHLSLTLKDIRFIPGIYYITVSLISDIMNYKFDYYDEIERGISFSIKNQIIFNRSLTRQSGLLLLTPDWRVH